MKFEKVSYEVWKKEVTKSNKTKRETLWYNCLLKACCDVNIWPNVHDMVSGIHTNMEHIWNQIEMPKRATMHSAGYDFITPIDLVISPGETVTVPTGIKWNPGDRTDTFLAIYPRSSLGRDYSLREPNIVSIIDADYYGIETNEGHIYVNLKNEGTNGDVIIPAGKAYAQGIISVFLKVEGDNVTTKRSGGFGSTSSKMKES